jgi:hypothetical protein
VGVKRDQASIGMPALSIALDAVTSIKLVGIACLRKHQHINGQHSFGLTLEMVLIAASMSTPAAVAAQPDC